MSTTLLQTRSDVRADRGTNACARDHVAGVLLALPPADFCARVTLALGKISRAWWLGPAGGGGGGTKKPGRMGGPRGGGGNLKRGGGGGVEFVFFEVGAFLKIFFFWVA